MAINPNTNATMSGRVTAPTLDYPYGSSKNESAPGAGDGTPYFLARADDIFGFQQWLLAQASIVPSGNADTVRASDYGDALRFLLNGAKASRRNLLIGNFFINQREVSGSVVLSSGDYGHDRFKAGAGGCSYTFATTNGVTTATISAGTLVQVVEAANIAAGGYILSHVGTAQVQINGGGFGDSGAVTATLDGSSNATVEYNAGTLSLPQLEPGAVVTSFDRRAVSEELSLCLYYYERIGKNGERTFFSEGGMVDADTFGGVIRYVEKRILPTITAPTADSAFTVNASGTRTSAAGGFSAGPDISGGTFLITMSTSDTAGYSGRCSVRNDINSSYFIGIDAEL
jgi:hypothetical protein